MNSRKKIAEAKEAAKAFIKAVERWESEHPKARPSGAFDNGLTSEQMARIRDQGGFGNKEAGEIKAHSIILTRRLADMRRSSWS